VKRYFIFKGYKVRHIENIQDSKGTKH
jgi:hypothetical protein